MNSPIVGRGEVPTPEEIEQMKVVEKVNLAIKLMGSLCMNVPMVPDHTQEFGALRIMIPAELFEYAMDLAEQVIHAVNFKPESPIVS